MSDLSVSLADELTDAVFKDTAPTIQPVANVYVTLFDDQGNELNGDLSNGRVQTSPSDWNKVTSNSVDNATQVDFGEALTDITNVQDVALYDSDSGGSNNELARYTLTDAPFDIASGSSVFFEAGDLTFDVIDRTQ